MLLTHKQCRIGPLCQCTDILVCSPTKQDAGWTWRLQPVWSMSHVSGTKGSMCLPTAARDVFLKVICLLCKSPSQSEVYFHTGCSCFATSLIGLCRIPPSNTGFTFHGRNPRNRCANDTPFVQDLLLPFCVLPFTLGRHCIPFNGHCMPHESTGAVTSQQRVH